MKFLFLALFLWGSGSLSLTGQDSVREEPLLPAALGIRTDGAGNSWNIESNGTIGRIGSTMVNSGLALEVNDEKFTSFQPSMTADGKEFILNGKQMESLPGLQVQRRIKLIEDTGGLRYVELFHNGSAETVVVNVSLISNFSGNYKTFVSDRGRTEPVVLQDFEGGIVVTPGSSQSTKAFLFTLSAPGDVVKPTIAAQNRYGLTFRYPLEIPPGETRSVVHMVSQVVIPQVFDRRALLTLFRPFSFAENRSSFDPRWRETVVNDKDPELRGSDLDLIAAIEDLGVARGARDTLAIGESSRLVGEVSGSAVSLVSNYGEAVFPLDRIAAISGKNGVDDRVPRLFLRDGQIISGEIETEGLTFVQVGGDQFALEIGDLDRVVFATSERDEFVLKDGAIMVETYQGDRLRLETGTGDSGLTGRTPWGNLHISLDQLVKLFSQPEVSLAYHVETEGGIRCMVYPDGNEVKVTLAEFGDYSFQPMEMKSVITAVKPETETSVADAREAHVSLRGDQAVTGRIGNSDLPVITADKLLETASDDIRIVEKINDSAVSPGGLPVQSPLFRVERWDGGSVTGFIDLDTISFQVQGETWTIPVRDIERIEAPSPDLSPDLSSSIRDLVEKLGADSWPVREQATKELGAFGYLAVPFLERELAASKDPEVSRRLERVLSGLN